MNSQRLLARVLLAVAVLALGAAIAWKLVDSRAEAEKTEAVFVPPLVTTTTLTPSTVRIEVEARGTVRASRSTTLVAELRGKLTSVEDALEVGAFFEAGDVLARIDPRDYELALVRSKAEIANAQHALEIELAEADAAIEEWKSTSDEPPPALVKREPQVAAARARHEAAVANLEVARRDLDRAVIRAPYAGRVRSKSVDVGQYVVPGTVLAQIYAVDYAEVRLPLQDRDLAYIDLPIDYRNARDDATGPDVEISAEFAGTVHRWHGKIVRTEGELDHTSRMVHAIARVEDPYGRTTNGSDPRPPLLVGMFVDAKIHGIEAEGVFVIPRAALREDREVLIVDEMNRLRRRPVGILRSEGDTTIIQAGVQAGERMCTTPLEAIVDGMLVRVRDGDAR